MTSSTESASETEPLLSSRSSVQADPDRSPVRNHHDDESSVRASRTSSPNKGLVPSPDGHPASRETSILLRIAASMYSFIILGMMVSTLGVMVPQFETYYGLTDFQVSFVFLVWPVGYIIAAYLNGVIHVRFGQRGIAVVGPLFHIILTIAASLHPPFPVLLVALALGSLGTGILDGSYCAWAGGMENANIVQGFLHGSYSTGAALGPFLAGTMLSVGHTTWYTWYYVLFGASVLEAIILVFAFRFEDATKYHQDPHKQAQLTPAREDADAGGADSHPSIFKHRVTWICAVYFLACVGTENAVSGWIVVFMTRINHASPYLASLSSSGFWIGQAAGRLALGAVTQKFGVRPATIAYLVAALAFEALFAAVRVPEVSTAVISLLGFCLGPLFPSGVFVATRLLPRELHVGAISFAVLIGQVGGALLPFALGALADTLGIQVFQAVVFAQLAVTLLIWLAFPRLPPGNATSSQDLVDEIANP
ncbi:MFS general substrate transporter [Hypoxylon rubiginosum]|uniref:MFS general substrate transporter n=1 Tax=Hypoxylon rubiginosum TaxID=110542 RepID=A0ACC0DMQ4_9PEZI|nr:MFS general substrate transporter [Hypoxylon rubiginosum]